MKGKTCSLRLRLLAGRMASLRRGSVTYWAEQWVRTWQASWHFASCLSFLFCENTSVLVLILPKKVSLLPGEALIEKR